MPEQLRNVFCRCLKGLLFTLLMLFTAGLQAQQPQGRLEVLDSLIDVGRPFSVRMTITHPEDVVVIFPDSAKEFAPFELYKSEPFHTETDSGISTDHAVYKLFTWAIDSVQKIALPFQMVKDGDTSGYLTNEDFFPVRELILNLTDSTQLKLIKGLQGIEEPFNVRAFAFFMACFLLLFILAIFLLRKPIMRFFRRRRVEREWQPIAAKLAALPPMIPRQADFIRELNHVWKQYIDRKHNAYFNALTTTELRQAIQSFDMIRPADRDLLSKASNTADLILFVEVGMTEADLYKLYEEVRAILEREYRRRKEAAEI